MLTCGVQLSAPHCLIFWESRSFIRCRFPFPHFASSSSWRFGSLRHWRLLGFGEVCLLCFISSSFCPAISISVVCRSSVRLGVLLYLLCFLRFSPIERECAARTAHGPLLAALRSVAQSGRPCATPCGAPCAWLTAADLVAGSQRPGTRSQEVRYASVHCGACAWRGALLW
jgi:hypothetical protein